MTATQLAEIVREYINRDAEKFNTRETSINIVMDALNDAKGYALKDQEWQFLRQQVDVVVPTEGLDITLEANGQFKKLDYIYETNSDGSLGCRRKLLSHLQTNDIFEDISQYYGDLYQMGRKIFVAGSTQDTNLTLVGYKYLPNYQTSEVEEDLFTEYASHYLKMFAINQLQLFQKEDQRSYISDKKVREAYMNLKYWDTSLKSTKDLQELL